MGKISMQNFGSSLSRCLLSGTILPLFIFQLQRVHHTIKTVCFHPSCRDPVGQEQELEKKVLKWAETPQVPFPYSKYWLFYFLPAPGHSLVPSGHCLWYFTQSLWLLPAGGLVSEELIYCQLQKKLLYFGEKEVEWVLRLSWRDVRACVEERNTPRLGSLSQLC